MGATDAAMSTPDFVVLGMIWRGARTGYDVKRRVATSIRFFWTISEAQIYPSLDRLEAAGLVTSQAATRGRRPRRDFSITPEGLRALRTWLTLPDPMAFELRDVALVRLYFADSLPAEEARALIEIVKARSAARIAALLEIQAAAPAPAFPRGPYQNLTLRLGIAFHQTIIEVCRAFEEEMAAP